MPSFTVIKTLLRELATFRRCSRVPEPDLIMDDPTKVAAFEEAGREDGVLAPVYLFHAAQTSEVLRPGETAVDLGCGPANQLGLIAQLNPEVEFVGVDLSQEMLGKAEGHIRELELGNVGFRSGDMTRLDFLPESSVDAVFSTVSLHHLPGVEDLERTFAEIARVLKPEGGLYVVDFGRLKSEKSMRDMAYLSADRQPELFTIDYLNSLRAAFEVSDFKRCAHRQFNGRVGVRSTFLTPFMVAVKSAPRRTLDEKLRESLRSRAQKLPELQRGELKELVRFFEAGGLKSRFLEATM